MEYEIGLDHSHFFRLKALLGLGCANLFLLHDQWLIFCFLFILAIFCELLHLKFNEVLRHNAKIILRDQKASEIRNRQKMLEELRQKRQYLESNYL
jgi:hypothetical protein